MYKVNIVSIISTKHLKRNNTLVVFFISEFLITAAGEFDTNLFYLATLKQLSPVVLYLDNADKQCQKFVGGELMSTLRQL